MRQEGAVVRDALWFDLMISSWMWELNFSSESTRTPRSRISVVAASGADESVYVVFPLFLPISKMLHLLSEIGSCHRVDHS